jgi:hypothetical protein
MSDNTAEVFDIATDAVAEKPRSELATTADFTLTLHDNEKIRENLTVMSELEAMFDDSDNPLPQSYFDIEGDIQFGDSIRLTMELIKGETK